MTRRRLAPWRLALPAVVSLAVVAFAHMNFPWVGALVLDLLLGWSSFLLAGLFHRLRDEGPAPLGRVVQRTYGLGSLGYIQEICLAGYYVESPEGPERLTGAP